MWPGALPRSGISISRKPKPGFSHAATQGPLLRSISWKARAISARKSGRFVISRSDPPGLLLYKVVYHAHPAVLQRASGVMRAT